jgi:hypothetical protein
MLTTADFLNLFKWSGIATIAFLLLAGLGFLFKWGIRFRLVGITGFMAVLTGGLFALSLVPLTRTEIPGAIRYARVYDNGSTQTVIAVPPTVTESELEATLRQAAGDLFSPGRFSRGEDKLTIRARTIVHPEPGVSKPLYIGKVRRSLAVRDDEEMELKIYSEKLPKLPKEAQPSQSEA